MRDMKNKCDHSIGFEHEGLERKALSVEVTRSTKERKF